MGDSEILKKLYKSLKKAEARVAELEGMQAEPVAVIGIACRFPGGASNPEAYWRMLVSGGDGVIDAPESRWGNVDWYDPDPDSPGKSYCGKGGFLIEPVDAFDCGFFNLSPQEVRAMDPQQRLLLEVSYELFQHAGIDVSSLKGSRTAVFCGIANSDYANAHLRSGLYELIDEHSVTGIALSTTVGRLSYYYGFTGPNIAIDTACSSSLVAVHLALRSLHSGECSLAIAGGVNLMLTPEGHIAFSKVNALSPDGRCKTFDASADGYGRGEGCGLLLLKRLTEAQRDRDNILAVIRGSAVNQDGRSNGFTAPNGLSQEMVVSDALRDAGLSPLSVDYVEAHGTGTSLGDPIEVGALVRTYCKDRDAFSPLWLGSVKANIGHLEAAAGSASLIKAVLMLKHRRIPPQINFNIPNPSIDWDRIPVRISTELKEIPEDKDTFIAGVSSFGFSGTNSHIVLEGYRVNEGSAEKKQPISNLLCLSAKDRDALQQIISAYADYLSKGNVTGFLGDMCYTAATGRTQFAHRASFCAASNDEMLKGLRHYDRKAVITSATDKRVVFIFSGQGGIYKSMGLHLYKTQPIFRQAIDRCAQIADSDCEYGLLDILYNERISSELFNTVENSHIALFAFQYALSELWKHWGIKPYGVIGHSIGEYAAACCAGILSLVDGIRLVLKRGRLIQSLDESGGMMAVFANEERVARLINDSEAALCIAAFNSPRNTVISGTLEALRDFSALLKKEGIHIRPLSVPQGFHSHIMEPVLEPFYFEASKIPFKKPELVIASTSFGRIVSGEMSTPSYWSGHIRMPVRYYDAINGLYAEGFRTFLEIGPSDAMTSIAAQCIDGEDCLIRSSFGSNHPANPEYEHILETLGALYCNGNTIDWRSFYSPFDLKRVELPLYPFQRRSYWMNLIKTSKHAESENAHPVEGSVFQVREYKDEISATSYAHTYSLDPSDIKASVRDMVLKCSEIFVSDEHMDTNLFELGFSSLMLVRLRDALKRAYGIEMQMSSFFRRTDTLQKVIDYILQNALRTNTTIVKVIQTALTPPAESGTKRADYVAFQKVLAKKTEGRASPDYISAFSSRYSSRTKGSKEHVQNHRRVSANPRNVTGFRMDWKEMVYQIIADRGEGSHLWDIDGNEYIDIAMGFGVHLFGHNPPFIRDALQESIVKGFPLGPLSSLAGEAAGLICELTGSERAVFLNTGTEAVMTAVRLARTVTGRMGIVIFAGSYHGHFDGLLAVAGEGISSSPMVPGTPTGMVSDVFVLKYGEPESLAFIEANCSHIGAVLVEPVQSRRPELQPVEFLRALRVLTEHKDIALIFDEMITGFRIHPGGVQHVFGIRADITTYGKIVGGGMPVGVVAGMARYLDAVDGGFWSFGDSSYPEQDNTFIAGTFNGNPLSMAAAKAVLTYIKAKGPAIQEVLNNRTDSLCLRLNDYFISEGINIRMVNFGSLFRFVLKGDEELLNYHLVEKGVYTWEGRNCFLSTAHTDENIEEILRIVRESVEEMGSAGIFRAAMGEDKSPINWVSTIPLCSAQRRLYALCQYKGGERAYHIPFAFRLEGRLEILRFCEAINRAVERHESLRTYFVLDAGDVVQRISERAAPEIRVVTIKKTELEGFINDSIHPFDLSAAPLMRVSIGKIIDDALTPSIKGESGEYIVVIDVHHLVFDGISSDLLIDEILRLYRNEPLGSLSVHYRDFVAEEHRYLNSAQYKADEDYWLNIFKDNDWSAELSLDMPRPPQRSFSGNRIFSIIDAEETSLLERLANTYGVSLFALLFAAHFVLLKKLSGEDIATAGTTFDGRDGDAYSGVVGMFVHTLPIRVEMSGNKLFRELAREIQSLALDAYDHCRYPFDALVQRLDQSSPSSASAYGGRNPLFDTVFLFEDVPSRSFADKDLTLKRYDITSSVSIFDITHEALKYEGSIVLSMEYNTDIFNAETVNRFADYYRSILRSVCADNLTDLLSINILSQDEQRHLLYTLNETSADYPKDLTIADLFERQVLNNPYSIALICGGIEYTYDQINSRANCIAKSLIGLTDFYEGCMVAILMERSADLICSILAVLKSGAAYLPIDTAYPLERMGYMLENSHCKVIIADNTGSRLCYELVCKIDTPPTGFSILNTDDIATGSAEDPVRRNSPYWPAYLIYTSGSTGTPKGCVVTNWNVVRLLFNSRNPFDFSGQDTWIMAHSHCFDFSVWEMYGALLYGGRLILPQMEDVRDTQRFLDILKHNRVTVLNQTPAAFYNLIVEESKSRSAELAGHLRYVIFGGDRLEFSNLRQWCDRYSPDKIALINMYGITETTVHVTYCRLSADDIFGSEKGSIVGKPLPETRVYLFDRDRRLVPMGAVGEIYVGGTGVCLGYMNRPELTVERFVSNPYEESERLYKSGDLARWLPDGRLEYIGRNDDQVQVRGYRIEPSEIQRHLLCHPQVSKAAAIAVHPKDGRTELAAYIICDECINVSDLRGYLQQRLPSYMIPTHFVRLESIPLTSNGKVDKKSLPLPWLGIASTMPTGTGYEPPHSEKEGILCDVFSQTLGREKVGIDDNYFALGGDSIKAIQVAARVQNKGLKIAIADIFRHPTIRELSEHCIGETNDKPEEAITGTFPLTAIQSWFFQEHKDDLHHYNQSVLLWSEQRLELTALNLAFQHIIKQHDALRTVFVNQEDSILQKYVDAYIFFEVSNTDLRGLGGLKDSIDSLWRHSAIIQASMRLDSPPLIRAHSYSLDDRDALFITIHHLVVDAVSWQFILEDLLGAYQLIRSGSMPNMHGRTDSIKRWAESVYRFALEERLLSQRDYWRSLAAAHADKLPILGLAEYNTYGDVEEREFALDEEETFHLLNIGQDMRTILLTALGRALGRWSGGSKFIIEMEGHGREAIYDDTDVTRTVGWFTSLYPVLIDISEPMDINAQLSRMSENLSNIPMKGIGYGILKYITPERLTSHISFVSQPEVRFNYLGETDNLLLTGGFSIFEGSIPHSVSRRLKRINAVDLDCMVIGKRLRVQISYDKIRLKSKQAHEILNLFAQELRGIVSCTNLDAQTNRLAERLFSISPMSSDEREYLINTFGDTLLKAELVYPLSPMQEGMLFHALRDEGSAYIEQFAFSLQGKVEPGLMEQSWNTLCDRHDTLRTIFLHKGLSSACQVVMRRLPLIFIFNDIRSLKPYEQQAMFRDWMDEDVAEGFVFSAGPLMRIGLFQCADQDFQMIWTHHHIILDGWSAGIILRELFQIYGILRGGSAPVMNPAPQYNRYIKWAAAQDKRAAYDYWSSYLDGLSFTPSIRNSILRQSILSNKGEDHDVLSSEKGKVTDHSQGVLTLRLSIDATASISSATRAKGLTMSALIQAIWAIGLSRITGYEDVVFGFIVSGRHPEVNGVEDMAGLFINTVPIRAKVLPDKKVYALAMELQQMLVSHSAFTYLSLSDIQALSPVSKDTGQGLIDHVLVFENYPLSRELFDIDTAFDTAFSVTDLIVREQTHYDLTVVIVPDEALTIEFRYNKAAFSPFMIEGLYGLIEAILLQTAKGLDMTILELKERLVMADERAEEARFADTIGRIDEDF